MIFTRDTAKKLEPLLPNDVEKAILLLLDAILKEKEDIFNNPEATDAQLREFKGQKTLISELKQYRARLNDSIIREKEAKDNVILSKSQ